MVATLKKISKNAQPFDSLSQTWWLSEVTPAVRSVYASTIRAHARQQLIDDKPFLSEAAYEEGWERLQERIDSGAYEWAPPVELGGAGPGKAIVAAMQSDAGFLQLVQLLLTEAHGEIEFSKLNDILNGNPDGAKAALRAAQNLPPLAVAPAEEKPEATKEKTEEPILSNAS